jgi:hypothetical protein
MSGHAMAVRPAGRESPRQPPRFTPHRIGNFQQRRNEATGFKLKRRERRVPVMGE